MIYDEMILKSLDFPHTEKCEANDNHCPDRPVAFIYHECCGYDYFVCESAFRALRAAITQMAESDGTRGLMCTSCGAAPAPVPTIRVLGA